MRYLSITWTFSLFLALAMSGCTTVPKPEPAADVFHVRVDNEDGTMRLLTMTLLPDGNGYLFDSELDLATKQKSGNRIAGTWQQVDRPLRVIFRAEGEKPLVFLPRTDGSLVYIGQRFSEVEDYIYVEKR